MEVREGTLNSDELPGLHSRNHSSLSSNAGRDGLHKVLTCSNFKSQLPPCLALTGHESNSSFLFLFCNPALFFALTQTGTYTFSTDLQSVMNNITLTDARYVSQKLRKANKLGAKMIFIQHSLLLRCVGDIYSTKHWSLRKRSSRAPYTSYTNKLQ